MRSKACAADGAQGDLSADEALPHILSGTGFVVHHDSGAIVIVRDEHVGNRGNAEPHLAAAHAPTASGAPLETVTVTSSKIGGDVQNIPISITAMSQEQLTQRKPRAAPIS